MITALLLGMTLQLPPKVVAVPFRSKEHRDTSVTYLVIHNDSSPNPRTTFRFLKKKKNSYHYYIDRSGIVYRLIDPAYVANHAGLSFYDGYLRMNQYSIGICLENVPPAEYTSAQYESLAWLVKQMYVRFPDSQSHRIVGHEDIAIPRGRKSDPGPYFLWSRLYTLLYQ